MGPAALSASPSSGSFGTVAVGSKSAPVSITLSNTGGTATGVLSSSVGGTGGAVFAIDSDGCSGSPLPPGQSCAVKLHFAPTAAGNQQAALDVGDGSVSASAALTGTGAMSAPPGTLAVTPTTQDFGTLATGSTSAPVSFTFANGGGSATPPLTVTLTGADSADFQLTDPCSGKPLAVGGSCKVSIAFAPSATGSQTASLAGAAQGLGTTTASLSGTAAAPAAFTVTPSTFDFGSILQGATTGKQTFTVQNVGGVASGVPAVAVSGSNATDFAISDSTCTSALAASAKCTFDVAFTPATTAAEAATVTVSGAATTSGTAAVTGTGLAPAAISLSPTSEPFGSWQQGKTSPDTTFTLTNAGGVQTGVLAITLGGTDASQFVLDNDLCSGTQLAATTGTCTVGVHFAPTAGTLGAVQATLQASATPGGTTAANLTGTALAPAALSISPASKAFGTWPWNGTSPAQAFTVTNTGGVATGTLTASLGGANPGDFSTSGDGCTGQTLAPLGTCSVSAAFSPQGNPLGALSASLNVGDGTVSTSAGLSATSAQPAALGITAQSGFTGFGSVVLSTPVSTTFTVTNGGGLTSGTISMSVSGSAEYALINDTCSNTTLGAGGTCTVGVTFDPTATGTAPAQLNLAASPGGPASYTLSGTGVTQAALAISPPTGFTGFGTQQAGTAGTSATYTITNTGGVSTGTVGVGLGSLAPAGDFTITANGCSGPLGPGASCPVTVQFTPPAGTSGYETATLSANASPGGAPTIGLSGTSYTPALIAMQPPSGFTGFGNVPIGNSSTFQFTLTNSGTQTAGAPTISTSNPLFTVSASTCGAGITTSCTFDVTFTPTSPPSTQNVTITATSSPGGTASYGPTSGTGTGAVLKLSPSSWTAQFNTCTNQTQDFTITNTGNIATSSPISISLAGTAIAPFQTGSYTCLTDLQPNTPCTIPLTFECPGFDSNSGIAGNGTMTISAGGAVAQSATLDVGAGVAITPNPGMSGIYVSYGNSYTQTFTVTNYMTTATHAFGIAFQFTGTGSTFYSGTDIDCSNVALQPYGSGANTCQFKVTFAPTGGNGTREDTTLMQVGYVVVGTTFVFATISEAPLEAYEQL
jgi:hypothetical protein